MENELLSRLCAKCTTMVTLSKFGDKTTTPMIPIAKKEFFQNLVYRQLDNTPILSEVLYCAFFTRNTQELILVKIAHGYQTLNTHPHISRDIVEYAQKVKAEAVVLVSTPIGSFLPDELKLITGDVMIACAKHNITVLDHVLFKQSEDKSISLHDDDMLDYCRLRYLEHKQLAGEK
jgi:DNA repair protein RadC